MRGTISIMVDILYQLSFCNHNYGFVIPSSNLFVCLFVCDGGGNSEKINFAHSVCF